MGIVKNKFIFSILVLFIISLTSISAFNFDDDVGDESSFGFMDGTFGGKPSTFYMPNNKSVIGNFSFNGGWLDDGCSIIDGSIYCQQGFFYNISSLNVTKQNLTITDDLIVDGRVGIGTSSPGFELEVNGAARFTKIGVGVDPTGNVMQVVGDVRLQDQVSMGGGAASPTLFVEDTGNVGIGTTSPTSRLTVNGTNASQGTFDIVNATGTSKFFVNASSGKVGIGTDSLDETLTINQSGDGKGLKIYGYDDESSSSLEFFVSNLGRTYIYSVGGKFYFEGDDGLNFRSGTGENINFNWGKGGDIKFFDTTSNVIIMKGDTGNVGIGVTDPTSRLTVNGTNASQATFEIVNETGTSKFFVNASSGNVGIGTDSPEDSFHIAGTVNSNIIIAPDQNSFLSTLATNAGGMRVDTGGRLHFDSPVDMKLNYNTRDLTGSRPFSIRHGSTVVLAITGGSDQTIGNVGIGATDPQNKLNVIGDGNFTSGLIVNGFIPAGLALYGYDNSRLEVIAGTPRLILENDGDRYVIDEGGDGLRFYRGGDNVTMRINNLSVQIGDTTEDKDLLVYGGLNVTGNITSENVFLPAYIRVPNNNSQDVVVSNQWVNVTLDKKQTDTQHNIGHTWNDNTNTTITINDAGVYFVHYTFSFVDSAPNPDAHVGMRLRKTDNTSIKGSYSEVDTFRQSEQVFNAHGFITKFDAGDKFTIQFVSDDTTISTYLHSTFESGSIVKLSIYKVSNI